MCMISIVLVEPRHPGNVGAIARAMQNFGFSDLVLVSPLCSPLDPEARRRAVHAQGILENARRVSLTDLRTSFDTLVATTAIVGTSYNLPRAPLRPQELVTALSGLNDNNHKIGIVLGRETDGLHNDEIAICDFTVSIPTPKENPTLNLSHAATILMYELSQLVPEPKIDDHITAVSGADLEQMNKMLGSLLDTIEFNPPEKKETQRIVWKRLFAKAFLTKREAFAIMGLLNHLLKKK